MSMQNVISPTVPAIEPVATHSASEERVAKRRGLGLLRASAVYLVLGVALAVVMGASGDHTLRSVHAHINLLGWGTLGLIGLVYLLLPGVGGNRLAAAHVVMHHAGLAAMMIGLSAKLYGVPAGEPLLAIGSTIAALAVALFAFNLLRNGRVN